MSLTNISRDSHWIKSRVSASQLAWPTVDGKYTSDSAVYQDFANAKAWSNAMAVGSGVYRSIGVNMKTGEEDYEPFRVKARVENGVKAAIIVGFAPATITGDDTVSEPTIIPFVDKFDDILMLAPQLSTDTYYQRPTCICLGVTNVSTAIVDANLSVQSLAVTPPPYSMGVS